VSRHPNLLAELRKLHQRPAGPREIKKSIPTGIGQAFVLPASTRRDERDVARTVRALNLATTSSRRAMNKVIRRRKEQYVYSIGAGLRPGSTYPGFGMISAASPTDAARSSPLHARSPRCTPRLAKEAVTDEELDLAKKQMANRLERADARAVVLDGTLGRMTFRDRQADDVRRDAAGLPGLHRRPGPATLSPNTTSRRRVRRDRDPEEGRGEAGINKQSPSVRRTTRSPERKRVGKRSPSVNEWVKRSPASASG